MDLKINNVSYKYSKIGYKDKSIFKDISFDIKTGLITSIIGESKTTLLELLAGTFTPNTGTITINDKPLNKNQIGIMHQLPIFLNNTVLEELISSILINDYKTDDNNKRIIDSLNLVGLNSSFINRDISTLSSSELTKLSLANALICNPKILLLDDPTYSLDYKDIKHISNLIKLLKKRYNKTIIIASNNIDFIHSITDYVAVVNKNEVVIDTKYNIFKNNLLLKKYNISEPSIIEFSSTVLNKKNIKIGYRDEINDLIKDIYRYK